MFVKARPAPLDRASALAALAILGLFAASEMALVGRKPKATAMSSGRNLAPWKISSADWKDIAVLAATCRDLVAVDTALRLRGIPTQLVGAAALLIGAGADVNAKDALADSPVLYAGAQGRLAILRLTLAAGADLKSTNRFGGTALIPACEKGHLENVRELLGTKIDVNHVNRLGWTALMETAMKKNRGPVHAEITRLLLAAGANPNLPDHQGVTPLAHAERAGNQVIAGLLRAAGGK